MINRSRLALLLACALALVVSARAQVFVSSHTNIKNGFLVPECKTVIQDAETSQLYPSAGVICTLNQNTLPIQTLPACFGNPVADCTATLGAVVEGADYQATARHGLVLTLLAGACVGNTNCLYDPLSYGFAGNTTPLDRQFGDNGTIFSGNVESFFNPTPDNTILIATTTETQFESAQVLPFVFHAKAGDTKQFNLNGNQLAKWIFTGSAGTTTPVAPSQGTTIQFNAPSTVPVQQVDALQGCKVDESHGVDCNSAQIIVEVLGVSIPPSNWDLTPPTNPDELLGGETVTYNAITTQGSQQVPFTVTWAKTDETSGGNFVNFVPGSNGTLTVQPQSAFQGANFDVDIQATNPIDPSVAKSGIFQIHIPTATPQLTITPIQGTTFEAVLNRSFDFAANVLGPLNPKNRNVKWGQSGLGSLFFGVPGTITFPDPNNLNAMTYVITHPPPNGTVTTTISACVGGTVDANANLQNGICATYDLKLSAPPRFTSPQLRINSGESIPVTITGTGFGAAPTFTFTDPTLSFTPGTFSGPDANGVTTVTGTLTAVPIAVSVAIPITVTSSLTTPSTPVTQNVVVRHVTTTFAVSPANPTLIVSQSQQFTPSLGCQTLDGQTCAVPQTSTCSLISGLGTMSAGCLYTAPASLAAQTQVQAQVCFTFGNLCMTFSMNLVPPPPPNPASNSSLNSYFDANGLYHIFYEAANQHLYDIQGNGNVPTTYVDLTLAAGAPPAAAGSALTFFIDNSNSPHWAYIGADGRINLIAQVGSAYNSYDLTTWAGNSPAAASGSPLISSFQATNYTQMWSYIGTNQHVYQLYGSTISTPSFTDITAAAANAPVAATGSALTFFLDSSNLSHWAYISANGRINLIAQVGSAYNFYDLTSWAGNSPAAVSGSPLISSFQATNYTQMWSYIGTNQHVYQLYGSTISTPSFTDITAAAANAPVAATGSALTFFLDSSNLSHWAYISANGRINLIAQVGTTYNFYDLTTWAGNSPLAASANPLAASFQSSNYGQAWAYIGGNQHIYELYGNNSNTPSNTDLIATTP